MVHSDIHGSIEVSMKRTAYAEIQYSREATALWREVEKLQSYGRSIQDLVSSPEVFGSYALMRKKLDPVLKASEILLGEIIQRADEFGARSASLRMRWKLAMVDQDIARLLTGLVKSFDRVTTAAQSMHLYLTDPESHLDEAESAEFFVPLFKSIRRQAALALGELHKVSQYVGRSKSPVHMHEGQEDTQFYQQVSDKIRGMLPQ